jgi:hypothetical protein
MSLPISTQPMKLPSCGQRFAELPQPEKRIATSEKGICVVWLEGKRLRINCKGGIDMTNCLRVIAALMMDEPEEIQRVKMRSTACTCC